MSEAHPGDHRRRLAVALRVLAFVLIAVGIVLTVPGGIQYLTDSKEGFEYCSEVDAPHGAEPFKAAYNSNFV